MKATELQKALESSITSCHPSDYWKNHMVRQIVKGEEMSKRTKLSTGIILVAVLMLVSAVALAVGILVLCQSGRDGCQRSPWSLESGR